MATLRIETRGTLSLMPLVTPLHIGSSAECGVVVASPGIAPWHASIERVENRLLVIPVAAGNIILLNGQLISHGKPIGHGDKVTVGETTITVQLDRLESAASRSAEQSGTGQSGVGQSGAGQSRVAAGNSGALEHSVSRVPGGSSLIHTTASGGQLSASSRQITVTCECGSTFRVPALFAGRKARCRQCGISILIPPLEASTSGSSLSAVKGISRPNAANSSKLPTSLPNKPDLPAIPQADYLPEDDLVLPPEGETEQSGPKPSRSAPAPGSAARAADDDLLLPPSPQVRRALPPEEDLLFARLDGDSPPPTAGKSSPNTAPKPVPAPSQKPAAPQPIAPVAKPAAPTPPVQKPASPSAPPSAAPKSASPRPASPQLTTAQPSTPKPAPTSNAPAAKPAAASSAAKPASSEPPVVQSRWVPAQPARSAGAAGRPAPPGAAKQSPRPAVSGKPEKPKTCGVCQTAVGPTERHQVCPSCKLPYHFDCWRENLGCATYGCDQVNALRTGPDISINPMAAAQGGWLPPGARHGEEVASFPWEFVLLGASALAALVSIVMFGVPSMVLALGTILYGVLGQRKLQTYAVVLGLVMGGLGSLFGFVASIFIWMH